MLVLRAAVALRDGCTIHSPCVPFALCYTHLACLGGLVLWFMIGCTLQWELHCNCTQHACPKEERVLWDLMSRVMDSFNWLVCEIMQISQGGCVRSITLGFTNGLDTLSSGALMVLSPSTIPVGMSVMGRVFSCLGAALDAFVDTSIWSQFQ